MARRQHAVDAQGVSTAPPSRKTRTVARRATSFEPAVAKAFGAVIRVERERQEIAQDRFALLAQVDRSYYGKLERGERQPSLALLLRVAKGLGVPAASLVAHVEADLGSRGGR